MSFINTPLKSLPVNDDKDLFQCGYELNLSVGRLGQKYTVVAM